MIIISLSALNNLQGRIYVALNVRNFNCPLPDETESFKNLKKYIFETLLTLLSLNHYPSVKDLTETPL